MAWRNDTIPLRGVRLPKNTSRSGPPGGIGPPLHPGLPHVTPQGLGGDRSDPVDGEQVAATPWAA